MKAPHPFPRSRAPLPAQVPPLPGEIPWRASFFSLVAVLPVPLMLLLYGMDGLILPAIILGGHSCLAFAAAAIGGLFLGLTAREREEPRRGLLRLGFLSNIVCAAAAFCFMFRLHEIPDPPMKDIPSLLRKTGG